MEVGQVELNFLLSLDDFVGYKDADGYEGDASDDNDNNDKGWDSSWRYLWENDLVVIVVVGKFLTVDLEIDSASDVELIGEVRYF